MTSSANFTQGSWYAADRGDYPDFGGKSRVILGGPILGPAARRIAAVHCEAGDVETEANVSLIVAAPAMYRALEAAERFIARNAGTDGEGEARLLPMIRLALSAARIG